jgi:hypothetical protein
MHEEQAVGGPNGHGRTGHIESQPYHYYSLAPENDFLMPSEGR